MMLLTFSLMVQMDRGGLRSFPCRHIFVVVDIELLLRVYIFILEERRKTLVSQRLAKTEKGGEGIRVKEGPFFLAVSRCQLWYSHQFCHPFFLVQMCFSPKQAQLPEGDLSQSGT